MEGDTERELQLRAHLALQPVGLLGPLSLHVFRQYGVLVQFLPVVKVTGKGLGLLGMADVHHIHGQLEVGLTFFKAFLVFNLEFTKTRPVSQSLCLQE